MMMNIKWFQVLLVIGSVVTVTVAQGSNRPPTSGFFGFFTNFVGSNLATFFRRASTTTAGVNSPYIATLTVSDSKQFAFTQKTITEIEYQTITEVKKSINGALVID